MNKKIIGLILLIGLVGCGLQSNGISDEHSNMWYEQTTYESDGHMILKMDAKHCNEITSTENGYKFYLCNK